MQKIVTRKEALDLGLDVYFTGKPCKSGHVAHRKVAGYCILCKRNVSKKSRIKRHLKIKEYKRNYHLRKKGEFHYTQRRKASKKQWLEKNSDRNKANKKKWVKKNEQKAKAIRRRSYLKNPLLWREAGRKYRAMKKKSLGCFTENQVVKLLAKQHGKCAFCYKKIEIKTLHRDHVVPLSKGGSNWIENIQLLCAFCNLSKKDKDPIEFARAHGRLL